MSLELVLHVGTHRTGSAAIRAAGEAAAGLLATHGLTFVPAPDDLDRVGRATDPDPALVERLARSIADLRERHPEGRCVLSSPDLAGATSCGYRNAATVAALLAEATADVRSRIVLVLRRHDAFLASLYAQQVLSGATLPLADWLETLDDSWFRWLDVVSGFRAAFGTDAVEVLFYGRDADPGWSAVRAFYELLGAPGVPEPANPNPGLHRSGLEVLRRVNGLCPPDAVARVRRALVAAAPSPATLLFPTDIRRALVEIYADDVHALESIGIEVPSWFTSATTAQEDHDPGWSVEEVAVRALVTLADQGPTDQDPTDQDPEPLTSGG